MIWGVSFPIYQQFVLSTFRNKLLTHLFKIIKPIINVLNFYLTYQMGNYYISWNFGVDIFHYQLRIISLSFYCALKPYKFNAYLIPPAVYLHSIKPYSMFDSDNKNNAKFLPASRILFYYSFVLFRWNLTKRIGLRFYSNS